MTIQDKMIGNHPSEGLFYDWIECQDTECTDKKRHRYLFEKDENRQQAIETVANWLVTYHLSPSKRMALSKKRKILEEYDFKEYAKSLQVFPNADKTKKGNIGEDICENVSKYIQSPGLFTDLMILIQYFDTLISYLPVKTDDKLIQLANSLSIREKWYIGATMSEIEKMHEKSIDVCNKYYGFHFPWIINAISKKLNLNGKSDEATVLENISLFSEIGVSNIESAKVYLSGIKSRESAIELATFININDAFSIKEQLLDVFKSVQNGEISCSEKAYRWLALLDTSNKYVAIKTLKKVVAHIAEEKAGEYNELVVKYYNNKIYFCSYDYKLKLPIRNNFQDKYEKLVEEQGLFFKKVSLERWELKSRNPYVHIVDS